MRTTGDARERERAQVQRPAGPGRTPGYLAVAAAAVLWAVGGTLASSLMARGASPVELTAARAWVTTLVLGVVIWRSRGRAPGWSTSLGLVVVFGLAIAAVNITYYVSLSLLPVAVAITIEYMAPALVVLWAAVAERRRPSVWMVGAIVLATLGVALLAELPLVLGATGLRLSGVGLVVAFGSAVSFATYMVVGERLGRRLPTRTIVFRGFAIASVLWLGVQAVRGRPDTLLDPDFLPGVMFLAIGTTVVPFLLFVWGLSRIRASEAGVTSTLEPLTAAVIAFVWLGQSLYPLQIVGGVMVLVGVSIVQLRRPAPPTVMEERAAVE